MADPIPFPDNAPWFGPLDPLQPVAPPGIAGRRLDYRPGANLLLDTRGDGSVPARVLRALADDCDLVRLAIEARKDRLMIDAFPKVKALFGDKGYDADRFCQALTERGITPCIPPKANRKVKIDYDTVLYRQRHKIENMFGRLKDWRRIHTRYDRCARTFMSAICIAAAVIFWI